MLLAVVLGEPEPPARDSDGVEEVGICGRLRPVGWVEEVANLLGGGRFVWRSMGLPLVAHGLDGGSLEFSNA